MSRPLTSLRLAASIAVAFATVTLTLTHAQASNNELETMVYGTITVLGAGNVAFTAYDLSRLAGGKRMSTEMRVLQGLWVVPQAALAARGFVSMATTDERIDRAWFIGAGIWAAWTIPLAVQAVFEPLRRRRAEDAPPNHATISVFGKAAVLSPAYVTDGQTRRPGLSLSGRF